jgi:hypothetical protein
LAIGRVHGHGINLIAGDVGALVLEDQLFVVDGKIGFGILAAESELARIFQMFQFRREKQRIGGFLLGAKDDATGTVQT